MDGTVHVGQIAQIIMDAGDLLRVGQQTLHLGLRAAIAQLEVIEHGVVLLGKALIGILDILHIRAHLVGVVSHIHHGHVGKLGGGIGILAHAGKQACRKAGGLLHVVVGRKAHSLVSLSRIVKNGLLGLHQGCIFVFNGIHRFAHGLSILFHALAACTKQRFNAADALLQGTAHIKGILDDLADASGGKHLFDGADQLGTNALAGLCAKAVRLFAEHVLQRTLDALRRRYDLHIGFCHFNVICHGQPPSTARIAASNSSGLSKLCTSEALPLSRPCRLSRMSGGAAPLPTHKRQYSRCSVSTASACSRVSSGTVWPESLSRLRLASGRPAARVAARCSGRARQSRMW